MTRDRRLSWINGLLLPLFNVLTAFIATGIVFLFIGVDPIEATKILIYGALGYDEGLGYTLYYATNFVFTGLAVAVALHVCVEKLYTRQPTQPHTQSLHSQANHLEHYKVHSHKSG